MRGLTDVSFIYLDEADFFPPGQQQDARDVLERYIAKSNPWIVMVSTSQCTRRPIRKDREGTRIYMSLQKVTTGLYLWIKQDIHTR